MIDMFKYVAVNNNGDFFVAVNSHREDFADFLEVNNSSEKLFANQTLRIYKYDILLNEESKQLVAEGLVDSGTSTMKATDTHLFYYTGQVNTAHLPRVYKINITPLENDFRTYELEEIMLDGDVNEIVDII